MLVGKTGYGPSCKQDDINALMVALAKAGKRVVRLKAGDPMIFGRAGEEIAALRACRHCLRGRARHHGGARRGGKPQAVAHAARVARRVQFVTGHAHGGRLPDDLDIAALADPHATTAVYMPLGNPRAARASASKRRCRA